MNDPNTPPILILLAAQAWTYSFLVPVISSLLLVISAGLTLTGLITYHLHKTSTFSKKVPHLL